MQADWLSLCGNNLHQQVNFSQCLLMVLYKVSDVFLIQVANLVLGISVLVAAVSSALQFSSVS